MKAIWVSARVHILKQNAVLSLLNIYIKIACPLFFFPKGNHQLTQEENFQFKEGF